SNKTMTKEEIHTVLDKMLSEPKSKTFLNHLVRAYMPVTNVEKVMETPASNFKCVLTKDSLFSAQDILEGIQTEEFKKDFHLQLKKILDDKADKTTAIAKLVGDKKLGLTGKETNTFMCYTAYQEFLDWIITKSLKGDKHINWLLGSIRRASFIEKAATISDKNVQKKVTNIKKGEKQLKPALFTLSDSNDVLAKLKAAMIAKENG
ncbi:MAG: hypothetical protein AABY22_23830, partial [Nanoarchaeota archaeon]